MYTLYIIKYIYINHNIYIYKNHNIYIIIYIYYIYHNIYIYKSYHLYNIFVLQTFCAVSFEKRQSQHDQARHAEATQFARALESLKV